jgi:hypothetical protein
LSAAFNLLPLGKFVDALDTAGVETRTAGGFWDGVTPDGDIVVKSWTAQAVRVEKTDRPPSREWIAGPMAIGQRGMLTFVRRVSLERRIGTAAGRSLPCDNVRN